MLVNETLVRIVRHLDDARAEAAEMLAAGCFMLAACRARDAAYLETLLARYVAGAHAEAA
jgi:hypothetical protein